MKPIIGILTCGFIRQSQFVPQSYIQAIETFKASPVIIPALLPSHELSAYLSLCDGFLFCGGEDVNPVLFNQELHPLSGHTNFLLDVFQIQFMEEVLKTQKPLLAICRGVQILNLARGGSLYQDLTLQPGASICHMQKTLSKGDICHQVKIQPGTLLSRILGDSVYTNSYHHQSIRDVGADLVVSARTSDKTIEALEFPDSPYVLGVQWHPEHMYESSKKMSRLFSSFIEAANNTLSAKIS
mgnify:FL=1